MILVWAIFSGILFSAIQYYLNIAHFNLSSPTILRFDHTQNNSHVNVGIILFSAVCYANSMFLKDYLGSVGMFEQF